MNERIYKQARFQFFGVWGISIGIPLVFMWLWGFVIPSESAISLPIWVAACAGIVLAIGVHFWLRKVFSKYSLVGTAIYAMYQKERKLDLAEKTQRRQQTGPVA